MTTLYYYKIYCQTDSQFEYTWSETPPTTCPINSGHSVDLSSVHADLEVAENTVKIKEENVPTGENYRAEGYLIDCATGPDVITTQDFIYPTPITVLAMHVTTTEENLGDEVTLTTAPNTIVGVLTASSETGATGLSVSQTVVDNILIGYHLTITDGVTADNLGAVTSIDTTNNKVEFENSPVRSYSALSPTYVQMNVHTIYNFTLGPPSTYVIGENKIGGSHVPAGIIVRAGYKNKSNTAKKMYAVIEYLY